MWKKKKKALHEDVQQLKRLRKHTTRKFFVGVNAQRREFQFAI